jgi:hypothetical protein
LITAGELDTSGLDVSITLDLNIEAVSVKLRSPEAGRQRRVVSMESQELSAEDVHAGLDIARESDDICAVVVQHLLVGPFLLSFEISVALDLEELDVLGFGIWSRNGSEILCRRESIHIL